MLFPDNQPWRRRPRSREDVLKWLNTRLLAIDDERIKFLIFGDDQALEEFSAFCHRLVEDRDVSFTEVHRKKLYKRWLSSGQRCLMAVTGTRGDMIGATVVLPISKSLCDDYCAGELDALDIEAFDIQDNAACDHRYLLVDIMAFDADKSEVLNGLAYRAVVRHFAELYDPKLHGGLTILCGTGDKGLAGRLQDLQLYPCAKERGADSYIYRAQITGLVGAPYHIQEMYDLIYRAIAEARRPLKRWRGKT